MRYVIYGAGAVGGVIGGRLHRAGIDVVMIARGAHLDALRRDGLELHTPDGVERIAVAAVGHPGEIECGDDDVVVLTMKGQDTVAALDALGDVAPAGITVVCAQNGVNNEREALRRFANTYAMCVWLPAMHVTPGVVVQHSSPIAGALPIGRYPAGVDERAEAIATDLRDAGFASESDASIMRAKYRKLLSNLGNALDAVVTDGFSTDLYRRAQAEGEAVLTAAGIEVQPAEEAQRQHITIKAVPGHEWLGSSSKQSLARGTGSIETDYLNGEVVLLGRLHGVPTPVNELLQREANAAARAGRPPGSRTLDELEAQLR